jgi:hypothetical protein
LRVARLLGSCAGCSPSGLPWRATLRNDTGRPAPSWAGRPIRAWFATIPVPGRHARQSEVTRAGAEEASSAPCRPNTGPARPLRRDTGGMPGLAVRVLRGDADPSGRLLEPLRASRVGDRFGKPRGRGGKVLVSGRVVERMLRGSTRSPGTDSPGAGGRYSGAGDSECGGDVYGGSARHAHPNSSFVSRESRTPASWGEITVWAGEVNHENSDSPLPLTLLPNARFLNELRDTPDLHTRVSSVSRGKKARRSAGAMAGETRLRNRSYLRRVLREQMEKKKFREKKMPPPVPCESSFGNPLFEWVPLGWVSDPATVPPLIGGDGLASATRIKSKAPKAG